MRCGGSSNNGCSHEHGVMSAREKPHIAVRPVNELTPDERDQILLLVWRAYKDPTLAETPPLEWFGDQFASICEVAVGARGEQGRSTHVLLGVRGRIVSHAAMLDRVLRIGAEEELAVAYVEDVATQPEVQGRGYGSRVMRALADRARKSGYELAALSTGSFGFYARLGWLTWRGPTSVRKDGEDIPTPGEQPMVLGLSRRVEALLPRWRDLPLNTDWRPGDPW
jgi:aminoglycoside 2'-N-acetyltransferase I